MLSLIEFLEEIERNHHTVTISPAEVPRLVQRYGTLVRTNGRRTRTIDAKDMTALLLWINTDPDLPAGQWCKDFGTFKLVGEGAIPKTFLTRYQACTGELV